MAKKKRSSNKGLVLSAPKEVTWVIAVIIGSLGILTQLGVLSVGISAFGLVLIGFVLLAIATAFKGI
ncbi:MAG: hypothetical protein KF821_03560 [Anaerolineales bacterium]|jgi:uncharacterized membrane protein YhhN|nr:hypothetical protein [Anaerolineales bacterium]MCW5887850.1 hypothetical protein [Anaerolineales bacterium]